MGVSGCGDAEIGDERRLELNVPCLGTNRPRCSVSQEDEASEVSFFDVEFERITDESRPEWCPHDKRPVGGEQSEGDVTQSGDESLHTRWNVGGDVAHGRRDTAGDRVKMVSFGLVEVQGSG